MNKNELITSASHVVPPSERSAALLTEHAEGCAKLLTDALQTREDFLNLVGVRNASLAATNHINHFHYIASLAALYDPASFVETVIWVLRTYRGKGFSAEYWNVMLPEAKKAVDILLPHEACGEIVVLHDWLMNNMPALLSTSEVTPSFFETLHTLERD